jgi:5'-methylthioadenosine phosphorylase/5'-methylthioinosine phosphorylase
MSALAIIGGSGFGRFPGLEVKSSRPVETRFGVTSAPLVEGVLEGQPIWFLARHGADHRTPPHCINYRANLRALADVGCTAIVGLGAVGGIHAAFGPGALCVPDQLIDYTHGRAQTFFDGGDDEAVVHVDFTQPFAEPLRQALVRAAAAARLGLHEGGTYGVSQGPRLETAAEIRRMARDGCDMVGMTAMPEAALARELGIDYATLAFVVNWGAGLSDELITMDSINAQIERCADDIRRLLAVLAEQRAISAA